MELDPDLRRAYPTARAMREQQARTLRAIEKLPPAAIVRIGLVAALLEERGQLEEVGGLAFLFELAVHAPSAEEVPELAARVAGTARQRQKEAG